MTTNRVSTAEQEVRQSGERWARAELRGDAATLDQMATEDFLLVGPFGFVLTKEQWLQRYQSGDLANQAFDWSDVRVRIHGAAAVLIGTQTQDSTYRGQPSAGRFRVTQVWLNEERNWRLLSIHLSPIAQAG